MSGSKRGDFDQVVSDSNIPGRETDWRDDGTVKWTVTKIDLHEVSVCTFPAYEETGVQARKKEVDQYKQRQLELRKTKLKERLEKIC